MNPDGKLALSPCCVPSCVFPLKVTLGITPPFYRRGNQDSEKPSDGLKLNDMVELAFVPEPAWF